MESLDNIRKKLADARAQSALTAPFTQILAASKGQGAEKIAAMINQGVTHFGENRVQEAESKWPALKKAHPGVTLHLIGPLQTNKVKDALALFDVIQTLDRHRLIDEIAKHDHTGKRFFAQVNTGEEAQKAGVSPSQTAELVGYARQKGLEVVGLMCIPPADDMPAPHFALLRQLALDLGLQELSMGMSADYETAARMGASYVRIGTALFGERV